MANASQDTPALIVISGPAGVGKNTVAQRLLRALPLRQALTATTRSPRDGDVDGRDSLFLTEDEFARRVERGDFLEHATVHGRRYGSLRSEVDAARRAGKHCLLLIDVQGARQVRRACPEALLIFLDAPDLATLDRRLRGRDTEGAGERQRRLATAAAERKRRDEFDHCVVNDDLDRAVARLCEIIREHVRAPR